MAAPQLARSKRIARPTLMGHVKIARMDHWVKNVFVLPGIVVPFAMEPNNLPDGLVWRMVMGGIAICLVASSNYVINEVMDAPFDRHHPLKRHRPVPAGLVNVPWAYVQWLALFAAGLAAAFAVSRALAVTMAVLWVMGCIYNLPPLRSKDVPYVDVLSESINNPLRMLAGWYISGSLLVPSVSLLVSYWMVGGYFMALKRYAELRDLNDGQVAADYRASFRYYTPERLLSSIVFYSSASMLCFGAFMMRYRLELLLAVPLIALVMAMYLSLAFEPDSAVQRPEGLYREPQLMAAVCICAAVMMILFFVDIPGLKAVLSPTLPITR